jgi:hypothetical protein
MLIVWASRAYQALALFFKGSQYRSRSRLTHRCWTKALAAQWSPLLPIARISFEANSDDSNDHTWLFNHYGDVIKTKTIATTEGLNRYVIFMNRLWSLQGRLEPQYLAYLMGDQSVLSHMMTSFGFKVSLESVSIAVPYPAIVHHTPII